MLNSTVNECRHSQNNDRNNLNSLGRGTKLQVDVDSHMSTVFFPFFEKFVVNYLLIPEMKRISGNYLSFTILPHTTLVK